MSCYDIFSQSGGHITVNSDVEQGACVKVYLPASTEFRDGAALNSVSVKPAHGHETVLLAEDGILVRGMVANALKYERYTVLQAANGDDALRLAQEACDQRIDLLLTDLVMPKMGGLELANRFNALRPETKIIFTSGYTDEPFFIEGINDPSFEFVQKPFVLSVSLTKVRKVLDWDK